MVKNAFKKKKGEIADLFPQRPNFSAELARKVCQELATLWEPIVASS